MFDHVHVQAYGKGTPLSEVGQVTIKSPTLAVINVYDPEVGHWALPPFQEIGLLIGHVYRTALLSCWRSSTPPSRLPNWS